MSQPAKPTTTGDRDLKFMLASTRQTVALLRAQLRAGQLDANFFNQRLGSVESFLDAIADRNMQGSDDRLARLNEIGRLIGSSLDLPTVLNHVMDAIIGITGADRAILMLLDEDGSLVTYGARNFNQDTIPATDATTSRTITRRVVETDAPIVTTNAQEDPRFSNQQSVISGSMRSIMAAPLRARGQVIGVIYVDNKIVTGLFSDDDLKLLDALASQSAVAIDNARLFGQTDSALQEKIAELTLLNRVDRQLNETLDSNRLMQILLDCIGQICSPERVSVIMLNDGGGDRASTYSSTPQMALRLDHPLVLEAARTLAPAFAENMSEDLTERPTPTPSKTDTVELSIVTSVSLVVPIVRDRRVTGVIALESTNPDGFPEPIRSLLMRVADRASLALENARLYDAIKAANLAKTEFVGSVAHELKVPMTSIMGYADLIAMSDPVTDRQRTYIGTIKTAVHRMKSMVTDLTDISRLETGYMSMELGRTDVLDAVRVAVDNVMPEITARNHRLIQEIDTELPTVRADGERLVQVLINLLSNAYKYTPNGGTIVMRANADSDRVILSVQDTGVGMTAEQLEKLGTKFWRADNGLGQPGTGLGFAITRSLIDLMDGELQIQSAPGAGSTFSFSLPSYNGR